MSSRETGYLSPLSEIKTAITRLEARSDLTKGEQAHLAFLRATAEQRNGRESPWETPKG